MIELDYWDERRGATIAQRLDTRAGDDSRCRGYDFYP